MAIPVAAAALAKAAGSWALRHPFAAAQLGSRAVSFGRDLSARAGTAAAQPTLASRAAGMMRTMAIALPLVGAAAYMAMQNTPK